MDGERREKAREEVYFVTFDLLHLQVHVLQESSAGGCFSLFNAYFLKF